MAKPINSPLGSSVYARYVLVLGSGANHIQFQELRTGNMKKLLLLISMALMVVGAALLFERPAYAYTDPGTGLLAIQAAGSALIAVGWYLRRKIYALLHWGARSKRGPEEYPAQKDSEPLP
jgi:hypothetical protein